MRNGRATILDCALGILGTAVSASAHGHAFNADADPDPDPDPMDESLSGWQLNDHDGKTLWRARGLTMHLDALSVGDVGGNPANGKEMALASQVGALYGGTAGLLAGERTHVLHRGRAPGFGDPKERLRPPAALQRHPVGGQGHSATPSPVCGPGRCTWSRAIRGRAPKPARSISPEPASMSRTGAGRDRPAGEKGSPWILSPRQDLAWFVLAPAWILALA